MSGYFTETKSLRGRVEVQLDLSNYATTNRFKKCSRC